MRSAVIPREDIDDALFEELEAEDSKPCNYKGNHPHVDSCDALAQYLLAFLDIDHDKPYERYFCPSHVWSYWRCARYSCFCPCTEHGRCEFARVRMVRIGC